MLWLSACWLPPWCINTPTEYWERLGPLLLIAAVLLLMLVLVPGLGRTVNGATRWISVAGINLQVSEPARLMVLMYIAGYAVRHKNDLGASFQDMFKPMLVVGVVCGYCYCWSLTSVPRSSCSRSRWACCSLPARRCAISFVMVLVLVAALGALARFEPYRWKRLIGFH